MISTLLKYLDSQSLPLPPPSIFSEITWRRWSIHPSTHALTDSLFNFISQVPWTSCNILISLYVFRYVYELPFFFWQFINHLINQLARHQFLKIACQLEKKNMLGAFALLKVVESELQAYLSATEGRVVRFPIFYNFCYNFCYQFISNMLYVII